MMMWRKLTGFMWKLTCSHQRNYGWGSETVRSGRQSTDIIKLHPNNGQTTVHNLIKIELLLREHKY